MAKMVPSTPRLTLTRADVKQIKEKIKKELMKPSCPVPTQELEQSRKALKDLRTDKNSFLSVATEIADLTADKNAAYGDAFAKSGDFLRLLYPDGIRPEQYGDALALVRIFDKQMRVANRKDAFGENPYRDIAGYGLLGAVKDA
jgi:hypothetical protein